MTGAAAKLARPVEPRLRQERGGSGPLPYRLALRPRRARRFPRRGIAFPQPRRRYPRLGWQHAMLVLWAAISAALLAAALALTASGHTTCARPMGTACPSPALPQQAGAGGR